MLCLIFCVVLSLLFLFVFILSNKSEQSIKTKKVTDGITKLLVFVPILVSIIFVILFCTVLKGRLVERSSHAVIVLSLWLYGTMFYVNVLKYFKNKTLLIINIIGMISSIVLAIYLTPLDRYVDVMFINIDKWTYAVGVMMLAIWYYVLINLNIKCLREKGKLKA